MKRPLLFYIDDDANDLLLFEDACREADVSFRLETANDGEAAMRFLKKAFESNPVPETHGTTPFLALGAF